jgi:hypothetical protein
LNDVHTVGVGRAFLDLHCLITFDAVQQINEGAFVVVGMVLAVPHFFAFSPISTRPRGASNPACLASQLNDFNLTGVLARTLYLSKKETIVTAG